MAEGLPRAGCRRVGRVRTYLSTTIGMPFHIQLPAPLQEQHMQGLHADPMGEKIHNMMMVKAYSPSPRRRWSGRPPSHLHPRINYPTEPNHPVGSYRQDLALCRRLRLLIQTSTSTTALVAPHHGATSMQITKPSPKHCMMTSNCNSNGQSGSVPRMLLSNES